MNERANTETTLNDSMGHPQNQIYSPHIYIQRYIISIAYDQELGKFERPANLISEKRKDFGVILQSLTRLEDQIYFEARSRMF